MREKEEAKEEAKAVEAKAAEAAVAEAAATVRDSIVIQGFSVSA